MLKKSLLAIMLILSSGCDNNDNTTTENAESPQPVPQVQQQENIKPHKSAKSNSVDLNSLIAERKNTGNIPNGEPNNKGVINSNNSYSDPVQTLNNLRAIYGLNTLYENRQLAFAAEKHAYYLKGQSQPSHFEDVNQPNFFGKDPMERALKSNYSNTSFTVGEVLAFYDGERNNE